MFQASRRGWVHVFMLSSCAMTMTLGPLGAITYSVFAKGEELEWAKTSHRKMLELGETPKQTVVANNNWMLTELLIKYKPFVIRYVWFVLI